MAKDCSLTIKGEEDTGRLLHAFLMNQAAPAKQDSSCMLQPILELLENRIKRPNQHPIVP